MNLKQILHRYNLLFILGIGIALRVYAHFRHEIWYDEGFTVQLIRKEWGRFFEVIISEFHPPLYYSLVKLWSSIFVRELWCIRLFSILCGVLSIYMVYLLVFKISQKKIIASSCALIVATCPLLVDYSIEARAYALMILFSIVSANYAFDAYKTDGINFSVRWLLCSFVCALNFLTHFMGTLVLSGLCFFVLFVNFSKIFSNECFETLRKIFLCLLCLLSYTFIAAITWAGVIVRVISERPPGLHWVKRADPDLLLESFYSFIFGVHIHTGGMLPPLQFIEPITISPYHGGVIILSLSLLLTVKYYLSKKSLYFNNSLFLLFSLSIVPLLFLYFISNVHNINYYLIRYIAHLGLFFFLLFLLLLFHYVKTETYQVIFAVLFSLFFVFCIQHSKYSQRFPKEMIEFFQKKKFKHITYGFGGTYVVLGSVINTDTKHYIKGEYQNYKSWSVMLPEDFVKEAPLKPSSILVAANKIRGGKYKFLKRFESEKFHYNIYLRK